MHGMSRWIVRFVVCLVAVIGVLRVTAEPKENTSIERVTRSNMEKAPVSDVVFMRNSSDVLKTFPIPEGTKHFRLDTIHGQVAGSVAATSHETLIYSARLGATITQVSPFLLIADDIFNNAAPGCVLRRFTFQTIGIANPASGGGAYSITYALYDNCPGAGGKIIEDLNSGQKITGQIPIGAERESEIITHSIIIPVDQNIILPCSVWLGLKTSRSNVGIIMGAPPIRGFSDDVVDFPGFACNADIGGFPSFGHATFNVEIFGDASCSPAFLGYRNEKAFKGGFSVGTDTLIADDIELGGQGCQMIAYEVGVRGPGLYTFDIRRDAGGIPGSSISGTRKLFVQNVNTFRSECFSFTSPISLDTNFWVTFKVNNDVGGWINNESNATWGNTTRSFAIRNGGVWEIVDSDDPNIPNFGGFYFSVQCEGEAPLGACCDMFLRDAEGDAVCRDLPQMNCSFPPRGGDLRPAWKQGASCRVCSHGINEDLLCSDIEDCLGMFCDDDGTECSVDDDCVDGSCVIATCVDNDPFTVICGQAACCKPSGANAPACENLTRNQCNAVEPVEGARQWQRGKLCGSQIQVCPRPECLERRGDCIGEENVLCKGGPLDGEPCDLDIGDCECRGCCDFSNQTCVGGENEFDPCSNDSNCPDGTCRGFCFGGISDPTDRCIAHSACQFEGCEDGTCIFEGPGPGICNGGTRHNSICFAPRDCECTTCECSAGCEDPTCCSNVCDSPLGDPFCCNICWDSACAAVASVVCPDSKTKNDTCSPESNTSGARLVKFGEFVEVDLRAASTSSSDPGICCHTGARRRCLGGGGQDDMLCESNDDCLCTTTDTIICCDQECCDAEPECTTPGSNGICRGRQEDPGAKAINTAWFRFVVPEGSKQDPEFVSVSLSTCGSNAPATDSVLQVFSIPTSDIGICEELGRCSDGFDCNTISQDCKDGSSCVAIALQCSVSAQDCPLGNDCLINLKLACDNLSAIGCNDDAVTGCSGQFFNSELCLPDLKRGQTYFVLLGAKEPEVIWTYRLTINGVSSCSATGLEDNDQCDNALVVAEGVHPFNLSQSTFSCPKELRCNNAIQNDVWYTYIPERSGLATIETCGPDAASTPTTQLIVYDECVCPPPPTLQCFQIGEDDCFFGASGTIEVNAGQCYLIRVGDAGDEGANRSGNLTISLELPDCNENGIIDDCELDCGPAKGICDGVQGCGTGKDCDGSGILDICEGISCCPVGELTWLDPPLDVVDARYPFDPFINTFAPVGISSIQVQGPPGADSVCWSFCDTLSSGNDILNVVENNGTYTITLINPIELGVCSTITYTDESAMKTRTKLIAHPANTNGLALADPVVDVNEMMSILNGSMPAFGIYSADLDHTGTIGPGDLLALIDLLNGSGPLDPWLGTLLPDCANCPQ